MLNSHPEIVKTNRWIYLLLVSHKMYIIYTYTHTYIYIYIHVYMYFSKPIQYCLNTGHKFLVQQFMNMIFHISKYVLKIDFNNCRMCTGH